MSDLWRTSLHQTIASLKASKELPRIAVVGIGHGLRGDDAAGLMIARYLKPLSAGQTNLLVVEGGSAPENRTGLLRRFAPDLVLLVDAAEMNESPGSIRWLPWTETSGMSASTHTLPPYILARYLRLELDCDVALIGIQPAQTAIGTTRSPAVKTAVRRVVKSLTSALETI